MKNILRAGKGDKESMRNQFFYNNNKTQAKKIRKSMKEKWTKAVCIGTLSATMLTGVPVIPPISAYTQEVCAAVSENTKTFHLSDSSLVTTKTITEFYGNKTEASYIDIAITEDGTYTITGSNKTVNGDVHISVEKGVNANIVLDNMEVENTGLYQMDMAGGVESDSRETLFPFMDIEGNVNLYLKGNNTITMPQTMPDGTAKNVGTVFQLYGQLTVRQAEGESAASLTANNAKCLINADCYGKYEYSNGTFLMESGEVTAAGASIYGVDRFFMTEGTITCDAVSTETKSQYCFMGGEINAVFKIPNVRVGEVKGTSSLDSGKVVDDCGYEMAKMSADGLPSEAKVSSINGCPVYFTETAEDGSLKTYFRKGSNVIKIGDTFYLYEYDWSSRMLHLVPDAELCNVQFVTGEGENETTYRNIKVKKDFTVGKLFDDVQYTYTYKTDQGEDFSESTVVDKDLKVVMTSSARTYNVKIDGVSQSMAYGTPLPEGKIYYSAGNRCCYYGGSPVAADMDLTSLELITDSEGVEYAEISSKEDLGTFYNIIKSDDRINGWLTQDIDMENTQISNNLQMYRGIFEGNGHTISNMSNKMSAGGFCRTLKGTVRNVCFEHISVSTDSIGASYGAAGVVCSINRGRIQNCQVVDSELAVIRNAWTEPGAAVEPIGTVAGINVGVIKDCYAAQNSVDTRVLLEEEDRSKILYPIAKNYGAIENCYYEAETEQEAEASDERAGIGRTQAAFASGEVCYLLNHKVSDGTQAWYQKLSGQDADPYPVLKKNDDNTVYYGYVKCARMYTNEKDTKAVHSFTYEAEKDTITVVCELDPSHRATEVIKAEAAVYDKKEHTAVVDYSDSWSEYDQLQPGTIQYLREGKVTTDLISAGTITAVIRQGDVQAAVEYTISKAALPENAPNAAISVPYTYKKITEDLFGIGNNWKSASEYIGKELPEMESVFVKAVYSGKDAANYETTTVEVAVQRSRCTHNLDKVNATAATEVKEGNKEYYICKDCGKLFEDAQGAKEITKESTVIPKIDKNPQVSETPKPTGTPTPTEPPKVTGTPTPTETPKATETPNPTEPPKATGTPTPTEPPKVTGTPNPTEPPKATGTPTPTETPKATESPNPTEPPKATESPNPTEPPKATETPTPTEPPKVTETPTTAEQPKATDTPNPAETPKTTEIPLLTGKPSPSGSSEDTVASLQILPALIQPVVSKTTKQILNWKRVKGADGYFIYASKCSDKNKIRKLKRIGTISSGEKTSYVVKKRKKNTAYKYEVQAYRIVNGKKTAFGRSLQLHALTKGSRGYANPIGVRISVKGKLTLKTGSTRKIKANAVLPKGKKCRWHIAKIRYLVSDSSVISISTKGKITAKSPGNAVVYAVTQNGVMAKLRVRVKK